MELPDKGVMVSSCPQSVVGDVQAKHLYRHFAE